MNYFDVYNSRINHMGESTAERIRNSGIRSFYKWMAQSPHTMRDLSVQRGIHFDGIILTSKDKEYQKIMFLNVSNSTPLLIGDIITWPLEDGGQEKWIIIQEEKKVNGTYRTFWIVRCNYLMKWVDSNGHVQQSWSYFVSSLDSKIKGNFRTWNSLISPQPNKYAEILMPRYPIDRATNFIVEQESWTVVQYDHTSVPGVIYLSLTEGKINSIYDDIENNIADTDKIAQYDLSIPDETQVFNIGDTISQSNLKYTLTKNGVPFTEQPVQLSSDNREVIDIVNGSLVAVGNGEANVIITLRNYPTIYQKLKVYVGIAESQFSAYIEGPDFIRLDREAIYTLKATETIVGAVTFSINNKQLAQFNKGRQQVNNFTCVVHANNKNKLDKFTLTAEYNNNLYTKEISIIPLW